MKDLVSFMNNYQPDTNPLLISVNHMAENYDQERDWIHHILLDLEKNLEENER